VTIKHVIVGLGNPGDEFENTRHNAGFDVMRALAGSAVWSRDESLFSEIAVVSVEGHDVMLACPQTGMNTSGLAVKALIDRLQLAPGDLLIVHDDVSLAHFGMLRFQHSGKAGGHHGIEHTVEQLSSNQFDRLKVGVGPDPGGAVRYKFVLAKLDDNDIKARYLALVNKSAEAIRAWVVDGVAKASCKFNRREPHV